MCTNRDGSIVCLRLPLGEEDALRGLVPDGCLGFLDILGRRIGDVTKVWSRTGDLKCLSPRAPSLGAQRWSASHLSAS